MSKKIEQAEKKLKKLKEKIKYYEDLKKKTESKYYKQFHLLCKYETEENLKKYKKYIKVGYYFRHVHDSRSARYLITKLMPNTFKYMDTHSCYNKQHQEYYADIVNAIKWHIEDKTMLGGVILYDENKNEIKLS